MTVRPSSITYGFNARKSRGITNRIDFNYNSLGANARNFYIEDTHGETGYYLASVTASSNGNLYRKYTLNYAHSLDQSTRKWTRLTSVTEENGQGELLNPVVFNWEYLPSSEIGASNIDIETDNNTRTETEKEKTFFSADLNGDGVSDIIKISKVKVIGLNDGNAHWFTYIYIYPSKVTNSGITYLKNPIKHMIECSCSLMDISYIVSCAPALDFDGDGYNDLVFSRNIINHGESTEIFSVIYGSDIANDSCGWYRSYSLLPPIPQSYYYRLQTSNSAPIFTCFDVDGNGKDDIICLETNKKNGSYPGFILNFKERTDSTAQDSTNISFSLSKTPKRLFTGDYNNDGLTDLIILHENGYKIYYNNGGDSLTAKFSEDNVTEGTTLCDHNKVEQGDFDGDGSIDFVYCKNNKQDIYIAKNNGNGTFSISKHSGLFEGTDVSDYNFLVYDIDCDGLSDK